MKQEIWKWIRANNSKALLLKPLGADNSIDRAAASVYPGIENAVVWRATDSVVGGVKLSEFDQYLESGASVRDLTLLASREIQRQLREKGVECIIRDSKTGEIL